jgi:signal transduction histidine kinase
MKATNDHDLTLVRTVDHILCDVIPERRRLLRRAAVSNYFFYSPVRRYLQDRLTGNVGRDYDLREEIIWDLLAPEYFVRDSVRTFARTQLLVLFRDELAKVSERTRQQIRFLETLLYAMTKFSSYPERVEDLLVLLEQVLPLADLHGAFLMYLCEGVLGNSDMTSRLLALAQERAEADPPDGAQGFWQELCGELLATRQNQMMATASMAEVSEVHQRDMVRDFVAEKSDADPREIYDGICATIGDFARPASFCYLYLEDPEGGYELKSTWNSQGRKPKPVLPGRDLAMLAISSLRIQTLTDSDLRRESDRYSCPFDLPDAMLLVPWLVGGRIIGSICVGRDHVTDKGFGPDDTRIILTAAGGLSGLVNDALRREKEARIEMSAQSLKKFAVALAHELNNPVGMLQNRLWIIRKNPGDADKVAESAEKAAELLRDVEQLVSSTRTLGRYQGLPRERLEFNDVVRGVMEEHRAAVADRAIRWRVRLCEGAVHVFANPTSLRQVFMHLFTNAREATEPGGHISVQTERAHGGVTCVVADSGCGIEPGDLNRVLDPFYSTKRSSSMRGLGLTMCRQILDEHKGTITVASAGRGQGTEVSVWLPLA